MRLRTGSYNKHIVEMYMVSPHVKFISALADPGGGGAPGAPPP